MKRSELQQIIREEIRNLKEGKLDKFYNARVKYIGKANYKRPMIGDVIRFDHGKLRIDVGDNTYILAEPSEVKIVDKKKAKKTFGEGVVKGLNYPEKLALKLTKAKFIKKGQSQNKMTGIIFKQMKKDLGVKKAGAVMDSPDFLNDAISAISTILGK